MYASSYNVLLSSSVGIDLSHTYLPRYNVHLSFSSFRFAVNFYALSQQYFYGLRLYFCHSEDDIEQIERPREDVSDFDSLEVPPSGVASEKEIANDEDPQEKSKEEEKKEQPKADEQDEQKIRDDRQKLEQQRYNNLKKLSFPKEAQGVGVRFHNR